MLNKEVLAAIANGERILDQSDYDTESEFECPKCGGSYFGSSSIGSVIQEYHCHDEYERGCSWSGKRSECFIMTYSQQTLAAELLEAYERIEELEKK